MTLEQKASGTGYEASVGSHDEAMWRQPERITRSQEAWVQPSHGPTEQNVMLWLC
jgi:hypothetical protein